MVVLRLPQQPQSCGRPATGHRGGAALAPATTSAVSFDFIRRHSPVSSFCLRSCLSLRSNDLIGENSKRGLDFLLRQGGQKIEYARSHVETGAKSVIGGWLPRTDPTRSPVTTCPL